MHVGTIAERSGVPRHADRWSWTCGFYPGLEPGQHRNGTGADFETARDAFERAWRALEPELSECQFEEFRHDRAWRAQRAAVHARGEKLPSEIPSSLMRCACGITFDSHDPAQNREHCPHIYAAQAGSFR